MADPPPQLDMQTELLVRKLVEQRVTTFSRWASAIAAVVGGLVVWGAFSVMKSSARDTVDSQLKQLKEKLSVAEERIVQISIDAATTVEQSKAQLSKSEELAKNSETKAMEKSNKATKLLAELERKLQTSTTVSQALEDVSKFADTIAENNDFQNAVVAKVLSPENGLVINGNVEIDGELALRNTASFVTEPRITKAGITLPYYNSMSEMPDPATLKRGTIVSVKVSNDEDYLAVNLDIPGSGLVWRTIETEPLP